MGGKKEKAPKQKAYMDVTPTTILQKVNPEQSYQDLAAFTERTKALTRAEQEKAERMTGTSAEIGLRQRGVELQEKASYLASLPGGKGSDPGLLGVALTPSGGVDYSKSTGVLPSGAANQFQPAREAAQMNLDAAKQAFAKAKAAKGVKDSYEPTGVDYSWAKDQSKIFGTEKFNK